MNAPVSPPPVRLATERPQDEAAVDALIDRAFGPGRLAKTAERLREGNRAAADLSFCAWEGERLVGAVRLWPVTVGDTPAVFLGPVAVEADCRRRGLAGELIARACEAAGAAGERLVLLVGDIGLFASSGFEPVPVGRAILPGPVDFRRLLWRPLQTDALDGVAGPVRARSRV